MLRRLVFLSRTFSMVRIQSLEIDEKLIELITDGAAGYLQRSGG